MNRLHSDPSRLLAASDQRRTSSEVRVWRIKSYSRRESTTYRVRWVVAGEEHHRSFTHERGADNFRSELLTAARRGVPFDVETGMPVTLLPAAETPSWYAHTCAFIDNKWPHLAPRSRHSLADGLASVTPALYTTTRGMPDAKLLRRALFNWAFNTGQRQAATPPAELAEAVRWLSRNTVAVSELSNPSLVRQALDALTRTVKGEPASGNTVARRRAAFSGALVYAVELGHLPANPLTRVRWRAPRSLEAVDPRCVVNHDQARALLAAVASQGEPGKRLMAFFACMYYAALRPAEVTDLRLSNLVLPEPRREEEHDEEAEWGELHISTSDPATARAWTDTGARTSRQLKHRARGEVRVAPCPPQLVRILRDHLDEFGTTPDGRLFPGAQGGSLPGSAYGRVFATAREAAFGADEASSSPLAERPYHLRHAAVSTWLNAGVDPTQVAEWAGQSVHVLLRVYAKCVAGRDAIARQRVAAMLTGRDQPDAGHGAAP